MNKNLIILFYPKTEKDLINKNIPLALLKIGSELKNSGYKVVIIDERFDRDYENILKNFLNKAIFFGVSAMTGYQIRGGLKASSYVKNINKEKPIVWGGWHPSILPEETLENKDIDIVVRGQGEATICDLAHALKDRQNLRNIRGILYKKNGNIISNEPRELQDLNEFRSLRLDMLKIERYIIKRPSGAKSIFWNSSQGCPYRCGFCSTPAVYRRRWSGLKAEKLLDQIGMLVRDYDINEVTFAEDNFFIDIRRIEEFCQGLIKNKLRIKWATDVRVDQINRFSEKFMHLLKESGCSKLYVGAESGDEEALKLIDKRIKVEDTYKAADKLARHKIISEFFMIVGFPVNPRKDLKRSLELIKKIKMRYPDHQFTSFLYTPYPGTPLLGLAEKHGLKIPDKLEDWIEWSILSVSTPWIDRKYLDTVNMYTKCFYPLTFPSSFLKEKFKKRYIGLLYKALHRLAQFRSKNEFFLFPIEWKLIKIFYKLKIKFNLFTNIESFR